MSQKKLLFNTASLTVFFSILISTCLYAKGPQFIPVPSADSMDKKQVSKVFKINDMKKALKESKKIVIGNYRVGFSVARTAYAKKEASTNTTSNGSWQTVTTYGGSEQRSTVLLKGMDTASLNAITEKAYKDLIKRLKDAGRDVVTMDQLAGSDEIFNKMDESKLNENGEYWTNIGIGEARELTIVTWPQNIPLWFMFGDVLDTGGSLKAAGNAMKQKNFGFVKAIAGEEKASVLDISVMIRFADTWKKGYKVGVTPGMKMELSKVALTTVKKTPFGTLPGAMGAIEGLKKGKGFDLGSDFAEYNLDTNDESSLYSKKKTVELIVTTTPENMEAAVLKGLLSLNAALATMAEEYKAK